MSWNYIVHFETGEIELITDTDASPQEMIANSETNARLYGLPRFWLDAVSWNEDPATNFASESTPLTTAQAAEPERVLPGIPVPVPTPTPEAVVSPPIQGLLTPAAPMIGGGIPLPINQPQPIGTIPVNVVRPTSTMVQDVGTISPLVLIGGAFLLYRIFR